MVQGQNTNSIILDDPALKIAMTATGATSVIQSFSKHYEKAKKQAEKGDPKRYLDQINNTLIARDDGLQFMSVLVDRASQMVWMSAETWVTITDNEKANWDFITEHEGWPSGMRYLMRDTSGIYKEAARRRPRSGDDLVDPLTQLEDDARNLLLSVATAEGALSELQLQMFAERLADVQARARALGEQLERVDATVELAGVALFDSE